MIELAWVLPLLTLLGSGLVEYGHYLALQHHLTQAARHAAREATLESADNASVESAVRDTLIGSGWSDAQWAVEVSPANLKDLPTGQEITITVTASWDTVGIDAMPDVLGGISAGKTMEARVVCTRQ